MTKGIPSEYSILYQGKLFRPWLYAYPLSWWYNLYTLEWLCRAQWKVVWLVHPKPLWRHGRGIRCVVRVGIERILFHLVLPPTFRDEVLFEKGEIASPYWQWTKDKPERLNNSSGTQKQSSEERCEEIASVQTKEVKLKAAKMMVVLYDGGGQSVRTCNMCVYQSALKG